MDNAPILVTGGAGFIGSNFVLNWVHAFPSRVINVDKLTYAGNRSNLKSLKDSSQHKFVVGDICDQELLLELLRRHRPWAVVHFAAESHVDRSIRDPQAFIRTNVVGTFTLLNAVRSYWDALPPSEKDRFRFLHVSTDEVYGSLSATDPAFTEETAYAPNSPYSASKAASDHLVRSYHRTYGLPTLTTNCSNNYGPFQFPEKLIPLMILNARNGKKLPIYGDGKNVRDWLYVADHCEAIRKVLTQGRVGETYNIGGDNELTNMEVVQTICRVMDSLLPGSASYERLIEFVPDRPGHDRRYAMNIGKIRRELGWSPRENFDSAIRKTIQWYLDNAEWVEQVTSGAYRDWIDTHYASV